MSVHKQIRSQLSGKLRIRIVGGERKFYEFSGIKTKFYLQILTNFYYNLILIFNNCLFLVP